MSIIIFLLGTMIGVFGGLMIGAAAILSIISSASQLQAMEEQHKKFLDDDDVRGNLWKKYPQRENPLSD